MLGANSTTVLLTKLLFPVFGSGWSAKIPNALVNDPVACARTTIVMTALLLTPRSPIAQLIAPAVFTQLPRVLVAETKSTAALNLFVTDTPVATAGPTFATVTRQVRLLPTATG